MFLSPISKQKPPFGLEKCPKLVSEWLNNIYLDGSLLQLTFNTPIFVTFTKHFKPSSAEIFGENTTKLSQLKIMQTIHKHGGSENKSKSSAV